MRVLIAIVCLQASVLVARGDVVYLSTGATLSGDVTELGEQGFQVALPGGVSVTLAPDQVTRVVEDTPAREQYTARQHAAPDTVEAQLALAKWCREQKLSDEFRVHLERVVELDPNHEEARALLAYRKTDGGWMTRDELMTDRGLVFFEGKFRTRQDVALRMREAQRTEQSADWGAKLKRWRRWLDDRDPDRVNEALGEFKSLRDPLAAKPLVELLQDEADVRVREVLLAAAAQIDHQDTVNVLVVASIEDPDEELRYQAMEYLVKSQRQGLVGPFAKLLKHPDNVMVNRAAVALGSLNDPSAMGPLIDALVTEHKRVTGSGSGGDTYSFSPSSGGFSMGGGGPKVTKFKLRNPDVLSALVRLSGGETFGYDAERWQQWLATQVIRQNVNLRRTQ